MSTTDLSEIAAFLSHWGYDDAAALIRNHYPTTEHNLHVGDRVTHIGTPGSTGTVEKFDGPDVIVRYDDDQEPYRAGAQSLRPLRTFCGLCGGSLHSRQEIDTDCCSDCAER